MTIALRIAHVRHVDSPHFTVCPGSGTSTCRLGTLPAGQADELQAAAWVQSAAASGEQVELTATASGTSTRSFNASGSVTVTSASAPPTSTPTPTPPPASTVTLPPVAALPASGTGITPGNPAGLFPTVSPDSSPSPSASLGFPSAKKQPVVHVATASAIVPLDPRLIGGQLAGLAVLAGAITIAIARLSLRKPRPQDGPGSDSTSK